MNICILLSSLYILEGRYTDRIESIKLGLIVENFDIYKLNF